MIIKQNSFAFFATMLFALIIGFSACTSETCDDISCDAVGSVDCVDGTCICDTGYHGSQCQYFCGPNSVGYDELTGACICADGWAGANCDINTTCGDNGTFNETTQECECNDGYYGANCDIFCGPNAVGTDVDGSCICADGWTGDDCNTPEGISASDFVGTYSVDAECTTGPNAGFMGEYISTITAGPGANQVTISNFGDYGISVVGNVLDSSSQNDLSINVTVDGVTFTGDGIFNSDLSALSIVYDATDPTIGTDGCFDVFFRQ